MLSWNLAPGGSFDDSIDAIFVEFDALEGLVGRTSSV